MKKSIIFSGDNMRIVDTYLLNFVLVIAPIITYLLYIAYKTTTNKEEQSLVFLIILITQNYLILRYGQNIESYIPLVIIDIPLIVSYYKENTTAIVITSIISIIYFYTFYEKHLLIILAEYLIYYFANIKNKKNYLTLLIFMLIKIIFIFYYQKIRIMIIINIIINYILSLFVIYLINQTERMLKLHKELKEISKQCDVQKAIFNISHEIKNPIAVCKGYLDMYNENNIEEAKDYIKVIKEEINRTLVLLEDFLTLGKLKINKEIVDINLLLEDVITSMDLLIKNNKIELINNITSEETYVIADYNRLTQVFINILKNSIEALENKKNAIIKIWTEFNDDEIIIKIRDNGKGMKKEVLNKIKEPFFTTKSKGSGLGVSLSNEIIKAHNGELKYISKENEYTLVQIILPIEKAI